MSSSIQFPYIPGDRGVHLIAFCPWGKPLYGLVHTSACDVNSNELQDAEFGMLRRLI